MHDDARALAARRAVGCAMQNISSVGGLPTCTVCCFSRHATVHPLVPWGMLADCFAPKTETECDGASARGRRDALAAAASLEDITERGGAAEAEAAAAGLQHGAVAVLLPRKTPVAVLQGVQYLVTVGGWALRRVEEPGGAAVAALAALGAGAAGMSSWRRGVRGAPPPRPRL